MAPKLAGAIAIAFLVAAALVIDSITGLEGDDRMQNAIILAFGIAAAARFVWTGATRFVDPSKRTTYGTYSHESAMIDGQRAQITRRTGSRKGKLSRGSALAMLGIGYFIFAAVAGLAVWVASKMR